MVQKNELTGRAIQHLFHRMVNREQVPKMDRIKFVRLGLQIPTVQSRVSVRVSQVTSLPMLQIQNRSF